MDSANLLALINELSAQGASLSLKEGKLKLQAPPGYLDPELLGRIKANRDRIIDFLAKPTSSEALPKADRSGSLPMSFAQERVWFLSQLEPESSTAYHVVAAMEIEGDADVSALQSALNAVIQRHESLRTHFASKDGAGIQVIRPEVSIELNEFTCDDDDDYTSILNKQIDTPFALERDALVRASLVHREDGNAIFLLVLHHAVTDDWSSGVLIQDFVSAYRIGRDSQLPELSWQYADFACWQRTWTESEDFQRSMEYWKERLSGTPVLTMPNDYPRPSQQDFSGATVKRVLEESTAERLDTLARETGNTLFSVLLAAFNAILFRMTGQGDFAVGCPVANRPLKEIEELVGFFTNTVVYSAQPHARMRFNDLLNATGAEVRASQDHQSVPFEKLVEVLAPERDMGINPLFQVCFSLLTSYRDQIDLGDIQMRRVDTPTHTARFDFTLMAERLDSGLRLEVEFATALFNPSTVDRFLKGFCLLLDAISSNPETEEGELPFATGTDLDLVVRERNRTNTSYPSSSSLADLFGEMAMAYPDAIALKTETEQMSYRELDVISNEWAAYFQSIGITPDMGVAVCARRSIPMIVGLLGVIKAGGYYLPFDEADPTQRLHGLFADAKVKVVYAPLEILGQHRGHGLTELDWSKDLKVSSDFKPQAIDPDRLAYVTFTSGSTGKPKGIMIPHRGVVRLVRDTNYLKYGPHQTILEVAPVSFDASTFEIWGAVCNGAQLVIMPPEKPSIQKLSEMIEMQGITTMYLTSAMFNLMVDERLEVLRGLKELLVGGDIISAPHARRLLEGEPGVALINGYGPTETTTFAACHTMRGAEDVGHSVSIGIPISNTTTYILDASMNPLPVGVFGQLYIGGDGGARGYLNLPELTAESFVPDPFSSNPGARMYDSGDVARWCEDGTLEFLGRKDNQVKVRGFRIELGEIDNTLRADNSVREAVTLAIDEGNGSKRLVVFVQTEPDTNLDKEALVQALAQSLPDYMIPSAWVEVKEFKLNRHNKIDRGGLIALWNERSVSNESVLVPPTNDLERVIESIWSDVLSCEQTSVEANFFEIGGHSLMATRILWKVQEIFMREVPLKTLFLQPTIRRFATTLEALESTPGKTMATARIYLKLHAMESGDVDALLASRSS